MKRICVVGPSLQMGGMERESVNMANYFSRQNFQVLYLAIFKHPPFLKLDSQVEFDEPKDRGRTEKLNLLSTILRIRKKLKEFKPDKVLAYNNVYAAITLLAVVNLNVPVYVRDGASPLYPWRNHLKLFFTSIFNLIPPKGVIAQTSISAKHQKKRFPDKVDIKVIPNILRDVEIIKIPKKKQILAVGRLNDRIKGFDRLVEAFSYVDARDWKLVFAGGGQEDSEYLFKLIDKFNLYNKVKFLGRVKNIDKIYAESEIFAIPSYSEGYPNALCEAMAAGLPCVAFDFVSGPRDIIDHDKNGFIVENNNVKLFAKQLQKLIDDKELRQRIGAEASKIKHKLNEQVVGKKFIEFMN